MFPALPVAGAGVATGVGRPRNVECGDEWVALYSTRGKTLWRGLGVVVLPPTWYVRNSTWSGRLGRTYVAAAAVVSRSGTAYYRVSRGNHARSHAAPPVTHRYHTCIGVYSLTCPWLLVPPAYIATLCLSSCPVRHPLQFVITWRSLYYNGKQLFC